MENSKEEEKINFPLFGNYIEKLRKIEVNFVYIYFLKAIFILLKSKIIFISIVFFLIVGSILK